MGVVSIKQPKPCLITYPVVQVVWAGSSQIKIAVTYDIAVLSHMVCLFWMKPTVHPPCRPLCIQSQGYLAILKWWIVALYVKYPHIRTGHKAVSKYPKVVTYFYPSRQLTTYLVTTKLGRTQQYTLLISIILAMSSALSTMRVFLVYLVPSSADISLKHIKDSLEPRKTRILHNSRWDYGRSGKNKKSHLGLGAWCEVDYLRR
jgi:hypothetical protein